MSVGQRSGKGKQFRFFCVCVSGESNWYVAQLPRPEGPRQMFVAIQDEKDCGLGLCGDSPKGGREELDMQPRDFLLYFWSPASFCKAQIQLSKGTPTWLCVVICGSKHSSFGIVLDSLSWSPKYTMLLERVMHWAFMVGSGHTGVNCYCGIQHININSPRGG